MFGSKPKKRSTGSRPTRRPTKPKVTLRCPASVYDGTDERTIEFSAMTTKGLAGGLINIRQKPNGDGLEVLVYMHDPNVTVREGKHG